MSGPITVVGAGLAGSLAAIFLAQRGYTVTVLERRPDLRKVDISAGRSINLALANRGIDALRRVGLMPQIEPLLTPMRGRMLHTPAGELGFQPYGRTPTEMIYSVSRGSLNAALMDAAEATGRVEIRFGTPCDGHDFDVDDGTPVIAADGAGSAIRAAMHAQRGITVSEELLEHGYKELTMPAGAGGAHAMDCNALHIWPRGGYMLIALPNLDGSFTVTLFLPVDGQDSFAALSGPAEVDAFFREHFADAHTLIPGLAEQFATNPTGRMVTVRSEPWHIGGQALLVGDAAHAIVPFHGQGMNAAFEDCVALDACIAEHGNDWEQVFADFEALRKPNSDAIATMALENYVEMRDLVAQPRFQLQKKLEFLLQERHPDRFIPRYAMVMFHSMPYAEAYTRGRVQKEILDALTQRVERIEDIDLDRADQLVVSRVPAPRSSSDTHSAHRPHGTRG
ncbi:MAG: FAD-dependent monooxygenase [Xanthomonadaceae bacterium]|nr:FAD-dependent monooxygenase [Xanthomonadaceae bacterium]